VGRGHLHAPEADPHPVHPHSRGERMSGKAFGQNDIGSSPLAWGEGLALGGGGGVPRFIPTRVGRGTCPAPVSGRSAVHPHSRGERDPADTEGGRADGSSPLAWGEARRRGGDGPAFRFIPTRVGRGSQRDSERAP